MNSTKANGRLYIFWGAIVGPRGLLQENRQSPKLPVWRENMQAHHGWPFMSRQITLGLARKTAFRYFVYMNCLLFWSMAIFIGLRLLSVLRKVIWWKCGIAIL